MHADCADGVINFQFLVDKLNAEHDNKSCQSTDDGSAYGRNGVTACRNGNQAGQCAV